MSLDLSLETQGIAERSESGFARLAAPDRLLEDWQALLAKNQHTHPPEAARLLDVPESALIASRIGSGAVRLVPNMVALLAPIAKWGRVLCAFSNACGVHMPLGEVEIREEDDVLILQGDHMRADIDKQAICDAYLFVDTDESHGNTRSLQLFDATGAPILKVFIFHKGLFQDAERHFLNHSADSQSCLIQTSMPMQSRFDPERLSLENDPDIGPVGGGVRELVAQELGNPGQYEVELIGEYARVVWQGQLGGARLDEMMFHLHESDIRSHLRFSAITSLNEARSGAITFSGKAGRVLRIMKGVEQ